MDYDALMQASVTYTGGILNQDTTEMSELLKPDNCTLFWMYEAPAATAVPTSSGTIKSGAPEVSHVSAVSQEGSATGIAGIAAATKKIFEWMQKSKSIAEPVVVGEARRAIRKTREEKGVPPVDPRQVSSRLTITFGRPAFQLRDECYFTEEGQLFLIDRTLVAPEDPTDPNYVADRAAFFGEGKPRINSSTPASVVLDFAFCELGEPMDMLRSAPVKGKRHKHSRIAKAEVVADDKLSGLYQGEERDADGKLKEAGVVKAKSAKTGEENAYLMNSENLEAARAKMRLGQEEQPTEKDVLRGLAAQLSSKYDADAVRACNNNIRHCNQLVPVFRALVANYFLTISWIDLSCNKLKELPMDLGALPLTSLYAHSNELGDWDNVIAALTPLKRLSVLTLHGNPISTKENTYKSECLARINAIPGRLVPLRSLDFVALTKCDRVVSDMHTRNSPRRKDGSLTPRKR